MTKFVVASRYTYNQRFELTGSGADDLNLCREIAQAHSEFHPLAQVVIFRYTLPQGFSQGDRRWAQFGPTDAELYEREYGVQMPITASLSSVVNSRESDWF